MRRGGKGRAGDHLSRAPEKARGCACECCGFVAFVLGSNPKSDVSAEYPYPLRPLHTSSTPFVLRGVPRCSSSAGSLWGDSYLTLYPPNDPSPSRAPVALEKGFPLCEPVCSSVTQNTNPLPQSCPENTMPTLGAHGISRHHVLYVLW